VRSHSGPAIGLALFGGLLVATQARVNGQFGQDVGSPAAAAMLSAAAGLVVATPLAWLAAPVRASLRRILSAIRRGDLPRVTLLAGALGAFLLFSQTYAVPALGVAIYSVLIVASLTGAGLLVDRTGLGPGGPQAVTPHRVAGAGMAVAAALVAAWPDLSAGALAVGAVLVVIVAGAGGATQSAMLGRLGVASGHPLAAIWINFVGATLALAGAVAVSSARGAMWEVPPLSWLWLGGPLGLLVVGTIVVAVPRAGVLVVTLAMTAGQLLGSLAWDAMAPVAGRALDAWSVAGATLLMGAVVLASRRDRTPR
jgi:transporter family-2 protein